MGVEITVEDDVAGMVDASDVVDLARSVLAQLRISSAAELSIAVVDEDEMARLHQEWLHEPGPTDVLSFPMDELREPLADEQPPWGVLGDVVICPAVAQRQAAQAGHSAQREVRWLLIHGILHLLGHDHAEADEAKVMFARQAALLEEYEESLSR
ncbi:MAG: rRNA maturation RNase YbeY [Actinobacteria bacterium]|nr:rRNA maturation RNase YbeY [Actinomycetota bacterium]